MIFPTYTLERRNNEVDEPLIVFQKLVNEQSRVTRFLESDVLKNNNVSV